MESEQFESTFNVLLCIALLVGNWKIFVKAHEKGWKGLIPIYNLYVEYKLVWKVRYFVISLLLSFVAGIIAAIIGTLGIAIIFGAENSGILLVLIVAEIVIGIMALVLQYKYVHRLAKSFNYGTGFTIGLFLLYPIFRLILAFGPSEYIGNTTLDDGNVTI